MSTTSTIRVGQAAEMLGVTVETLRRWETEGRLRMSRSEGGQRLVEVREVRRLLDERRKETRERPIVAQSARNRFTGIVTRIERDGVAGLERLRGAYRDLGKAPEGLNLLRGLLAKYPSLDIFNVVFTCTLDQQGAEAAYQFVRDEMRDRKSTRLNSSHRT